MKIKCKDCGKEFTDEPNEYPAKVHVHQGEAVCDECLIGSGVLPDHKAEDHERLITEKAWYYTRPF